MLARRLALQIGRSDWWDFYEEHTNYQWACQVAAEQVDPTGDDRADRRAAMMTANLMAMQSSEPIDPSQFSEMIKALSHYLPDVSDYQEVDDMRAVKLLQKRDE